jgi:HSP20 family protein
MFQNKHQEGQKVPFEYHNQSTGVNPGPSPYGATGGHLYPPAPALAWQPRVDIFEGRDSFLVVAEVPGVNPDQLDVESEAHRLLISGQSPPVVSSDGNSMAVYARERVWGGFSRSVPLPPHANLDQAEATCRNGLLEIRVPKQQTATCSADTAESPVQAEPSSMPGNGVSSTYQAGSRAPKRPGRTAKSTKL